jgi:hypothetical protein
MWNMLEQQQQQQQRASVGNHLCSVTRVLMKRMNKD